MRRTRAFGLGLLGLVILAAVWELYKSFGPESGIVIGDRAITPRTGDRAMPHLWEMGSRLFAPAVGRSGDPLWSKVWEASLFSLKIAAAGWVIGLVVGVALALLMQRLQAAEAAILPWVVLSQTVPLIAIAPLVRRWGSQIEFGEFVWKSDYSVALIAAYLAFFPIAVGMLRGLKAPDTTHVDLMRTYGVGWWRTLISLRVPASVPYLTNTTAAWVSPQIRTSSFCIRSRVISSSAPNGSSISNSRGRLGQRAGDGNPLLHEKNSPGATSRSTSSKAVDPLRPDRRHAGT